MTYGDPQTAVALFDSPGARSWAISQRSRRRRRPVARGLSERRSSGCAARPTPREGVDRHPPAANGQWLVSGRIVGEGLALRETLESSLLIALVVCRLLGLLCGVVLAQYVGRRIGRHRRGRGPDQRAAILASAMPAVRQRRCVRSAGRQINAMLDRISGLMDELRMLTDSLAHDLRSPVSRLALRGACGGRDERSEGTGRIARKRDPPGGFADADLDRGAGDQPLGSADRPQPVRLVRRSASSRPNSPKCTSRVAEEQGATLKFERPQRRDPLYGHRQLLAQAISNLHRKCHPLRLDRRRNSRRRRNRREARCGSRSRTAGPAFPTELRGEAMRRFGRLDSSRSDEGAGLGLALAEAIAHLHEGI